MLVLELDPAQFAPRAGFPSRLFHGGLELALKVRRVGVSVVQHVQVVALAVLPAGGEHGAAPQFPTFAVGGMFADVFV